MKKYLAKIIASDQEGLQMISVCSSGAKVKVAEIKYLKSSKVFLLSIQRTKIENDQESKKINSICRFDFVDKVKSKNIDQSNQEMVLELIGIDYLKNNGIKLIDECPRIGAEGFLIAFLHPKSTHGLLVELCQSA